MYNELCGPAINRIANTYNKLCFPHPHASPKSNDPNKQENAGTLLWIVDKSEQGCGGGLGGEVMLGRVKNAPRSLRLYSLCTLAVVMPLQPARSSKQKSTWTKSQTMVSFLNPLWIRYFKVDRERNSERERDREKRIDKETYSKVIPLSQYGICLGNLAESGLYVVRNTKAPCASYI